MTSLTQQPIQQPQGQPDPTSIEFWSKSFDRKEAADAEAWGSTMRVAIKTNPETAALADTLSKKMGMPLLKAQEDMGFLRAVSVMQRMKDDDIRSTNPVLYRSFQGLEFARKAWDDFEGLSASERWAKGWKSGGLTAERGRLAAKLWLSGGLEWDEKAGRYKQNATDRMQRREDLARLEQVQVEQAQLGPITGFVGNAAKIAGQWGDAVPRALSAGVKTAAVTGGASLLAGPAAPVAVGPAALGGFGIGFSAQYTADTFATMAGNAYADMVAANYDPDRALAASVGIGIVGTALELTGLNVATSAVRQKVMGALWKRAASEVAKDVPSGFLRGYLTEYGKVIAAETSTELAQEFASIIGEQLARRGGEDDMNPNGVASRLWEVASSTVQGMALLGIPGGVAGGFQNRVAAHQREELKRAQDQRDYYKQGQGIEPKMLERDPEASADLMRQMLRQGDGPTEAHVDAATFRTLLEKIDAEGAASGQLRKSTLDSLEEIVPGIKQQFADAEAVSGDVSIPTADLWARIRKVLPEFEAAFSDVMRLDPQAPDADSAPQSSKPNPYAGREDWQEANKTSDAYAEDSSRLPLTFELVGYLGQAGDAVGRDTTTGEFRVFSVIEQKALAEKRKDRAFRDKERADAKIAYANSSLVTPEMGTEADKQFATELKQIERQTAQSIAGAAGVQLSQTQASMVARAYAAMVENIAREEGMTPSRAVEGYGIKEWLTGDGLDGRGRFDAQRMAVIFTGKSNVASALHEPTHWFVEVVQRLDQKGSKYGKEQMDRLLAHWKLDRDQWAALTPEQRVPYLEDIAYNAEDYFASGEAPSAELRGVFTKLRSFLVGIYGAVRKFLTGAYSEEHGGAQLRAISPELRSFFDRMLASDAAIEIETASRAGAARLSDAAAKAMGIEGEQLAEIRAKEAEAIEEAKAALTAEAVRGGRLFAAGRRNAEAAVKAKLDEARAKIRAQVEQDVASRPVYRAQTFIREGEIEQDDGTMKPAKLDTDAVRAILGDDEKLDAYRKQVDAARAAAEAAAVQGSAEIAKARASAVASEVASNESALAKERAAFEKKALEQAKETVGAKPVHQAITFIKNGTVDDNGKQKPAKLDRGAVRSIAGKTSLGRAQEVLDKIDQALMRKDGVSPDVVAGMFGFPNAITMIEELVKADFDKEVSAEVKRLRKESGLFDKALDRGAVALGAEQAIPSPAAAKAAFRAGEAASRAAAQIARPQLVSDLIASLTRKDGTNPDLMARQFGFASGEAMLRAILNAPSQDELIEAETAQRLEADEPLANPKEFKRAVEEALHGKTAGRLAATILRAMLRGIKSTAELEAGAREAARVAIARTPIGKISVRGFAQAELRAAKARDKAIASGDVAAAIEAQRRLLVQHYLTLEAAKAEREIERETATIAKRFEQPDDKLKQGRNLDVVKVAIAMLGKWGMISAPRYNAAVEHLAQWEQLNKEGYEPYRVRLGILVEKAVPMEQMTLDSFRVVAGAADGFWSEAKRSNQVLVNGVLVDRQLAQAQILDQIVDTFGREDGKLPDFRPEEMHDWSMGAILANMTRLEAWAIKMDGGKPGMVHRYVYLPLKDALVANELEKVAQHAWARDHMAKHAAIKPLSGQEMDLQPILGQGKDFVFKSRAHLVGTLYLLGTEKGRTNFIVGNGIGPMTPGTTYDEAYAIGWEKWQRAMQYAVDKGWLFEEDFKLAQEVVDHIAATLKDRLFRTAFELYGERPHEEKASSWQTPFGTLPGGYFPSKVDGTKSRVRTNQQLSALMHGAEEYRKTHASVPRGTLIKRGEQVVQPRITDMRLLTQHIDEVLNIIHLQPAIRDVAGLFNGNTRTNEQLGALREALDQVAPFAERKILLPALDRMARDSIVAPGDKGLAKTVAYLRQAASMAFLGFNPKNAALQFTGLVNAIPEVGFKNLMGAFWTHWHSPQQLVESIRAQSPAMRARWSSELQLLAQDMDRMLEPSRLNDARKTAAQAAFFMQRMAQMFVDAMVWQAANDKATAEGLSTEVAGERADAAVRLTQGEKTPLDVPNFLSGNAIAQLFTQFADYPNTVLNQNLAAPEGRRFAVFAWTVIAPALATSAIGLTLAFGKVGKGERDDESYAKQLLEHFLGDQVRGAFGLLPIAGPLVGSALNELFGLSNTPGGMRNSPFAAWSIVETLSRIGSGQGSYADWITGLNIALQIPGRPVANLVRFEQNVAAGRTTYDGPLDYLRVLLTGKD